MVVIEQVVKDISEGDSRGSLVDLKGKIPLQTSLAQPQNKDIIDEQETAADDRKILEDFLLRLQQENTAAVRPNGLTATLFSSAGEAVREGRMVVEKVDSFLSQKGEKGDFSPQERQRLVAVLTSPSMDRERLRPFPPLLNRRISPERLIEMLDLLALPQGSQRIFGASSLTFARVLSRCYRPCYRPSLEKSRRTADRERERGQESAETIILDYREEEEEGFFIRDEIRHIRRNIIEGALTNSQFLAYLKGERSSLSPSLRQQLAMDLDSLGETDDKTAIIDVLRANLGDSVRLSDLLEGEELEEGGEDAEEELFSLYIISQQFLHLAQREELSELEEKINPEIEKLRAIIKRVPQWNFEIKIVEQINNKGKRRLLGEEELVCEEDILEDILLSLTEAVIPGAVARVVEGISSSPLLNRWLDIRRLLSLELNYRQAMQALNQFLETPLTAEARGILLQRIKEAYGLPQAIMKIDISAAETPAEIWSLVLKKLKGASSGLTSREEVARLLVLNRMIKLILTADPASVYFLSLYRQEEMLEAIMKMQEIRAADGVKLPEVSIPREEKPFLLDREKIVAAITKDGYYNDERQKTIRTLVEILCAFVEQAIVDRRKITMLPNAVLSGNPGSGKTHTMLNIAREINRQIEEQTDFSVFGVYCLVSSVTPTGIQGTNIADLEFQAMVNAIRSRYPQMTFAEVLDGINSGKFIFFVGWDEALNALLQRGGADSTLASMMKSLALEMTGILDPLVAQGRTSYSASLRTQGGGGESFMLRPVAYHLIMSSFASVLDALAAIYGKRRSDIGDKIVINRESLYRVGIRQDLIERIGPYLGFIDYSPRELFQAFNMRQLRMVVDSLRKIGFNLESSEPIVWSENNNSLIRIIEELKSRQFRGLDLIAESLDIVVRAKLASGEIPDDFIRQNPDGTISIVITPQLIDEVKTHLIRIGSL